MKKHRYYTSVHATARLVGLTWFTLRDALASLGPAARKASEAMVKLAEATAGAGGARRW